MQLRVTKIFYGQHQNPDWRWRVLPGKHEGFTLWSVWGGEGRLTIGRTCVELCAGDVFLIDYRQEVQGEQSPENPLLVRYADFTPAVPFTPGAWAGHRHLNRTAFFGEVFDRLRDACYRHDRELGELWLASLLAEYRDVHAAQAASNPDAEKIDRICAELKRHTERPCSVRALAQEFHCCEDHFIRIFQRRTGLTPYAYLQHARLEMARTLLHNSSNRIGEIAQACGFSSIYEFSRFFHKKTGQSPTAFRLVNERLAPKTGGPRKTPLRPAAAVSGRQTDRKQAPRRSATAATACSSLG